MGLLDVLQSASNAVAGNVAGPVDLLSFALRKAGIPVPEDALGGSEWMKRKGLMRDVPHGAEQVVGETLGLLAPTAIAANAPKIARGLLQAQENAAAPRTLNPETGAIVWHGSPHKFDKFDASKIGTGEGAQAYGHGIYLAETPGVAKSYVAAGGAKPTATPEAYAADLVGMMGGEQKALKHLRNILPPTGKTAFSGESHELISGAIKAIEGGSYRQSPGFLYKADLPDEWLPKMLDWDKPLSQQAPMVQSILADELKRIGGSAHTGERAYKELMFEARMQGNKSASGVMKNNAEALEASKRLQELGIPGIRYLDAASRPSPNIIDQRLLGLLQKHDGNAEAAVDAFMRGVYNTPKQKALMRADLLKQLSVKPTSNFVIFPGLEDQLKILERNGVGLLTP